MVRMSRRRRGFTLLWALLHLALPALGTVAEASAAASAAPGATHVEDRSGPGCQPVHAPDCARCQTLLTHAAAPSPPMAWAGVPPQVFQPTEVAGPRDAGRRALARSRAPPSHS